MEIKRLFCGKGRKKFEEDVERIKVELLSYRLHGETNECKKPKILKNVKNSWQSWIIGRNATFYEVGNTIYAKMGELFCPLMGFPEPKDMELPLSALRAKYPDRFIKIGKKDKFVYADGWCRLMELNTGWIKISGLKEALGNDFCYIRIAPIVQKLFDELCSLSAQKDKFLTLNGYDEDSMAYYRLCQNIVEHYYIKNHETYFRNNKQE